MAEHQTRLPSPQVYRLLFVLRNVLWAHGVPGFDAWVERVELEAAARGLTLSSRMTSWSRMRPGGDPPPQRERRRSRPAKPAEPAPA